MVRSPLFIGIIGLTIQILTRRVLSQVWKGDCAVNPYPESVVSGMEGRLCCELIEVEQCIELMKVYCNNTIVMY